MFRMNAATLRATLQQLEQATRDHAEWHERLVRTLICRLRPYPNDLAENAHRLCRFGHWYYGAVSAELREQPAFVSMESEHRRLHAIASALLREMTDNGAVDRKGYDALSEVSAKLRLELDSLRHEIQAALRASDALTGAYGRSEVLPELREWRELARRKMQQCCIAFMDLDHFKVINDRHGHAVGDRVLAGAVEYVTRNLRPYDKVFRYGGDEFLISLPGADLTTGQKVIKRIREGLANRSLIAVPGELGIKVTASFGLASLDPEASVEECIERADRALLLAKAAGRNCAMSWDPTITTGTMSAWTPEVDAVE